MKKEEIQEKINKLRSLGKDRSEMKLWEEIMPNMTEQELTDLSISLDDEIRFITEK